MTAHRPGAPGTVPFRFDGREFRGRENDTIASALLANGVAVVGRSFKYHRPRGVFGAWTEEPNALFDVTVDGRTTPNLRGTTERLRAGMDVRAVNSWPSAEADRKGALDRLHRFLPAGFYYKTFLWPDWGRFEGSIRRMAGLGTLDPAHAPPADVAHRDDKCDLLVVGAGPAGLAAAIAGVRAGKSVVLADDRPTPGGSLLWRPAAVDGMSGPQWAHGAALRLRERGARVLLETTAFGIYDHNLAGLWERRPGRPDRLWRLRAERIVVATGAIERPLVFPDNDRPGVMLADAALVYLRQHEVLVGGNVVVATNNDRAFAVAGALAQAGARVTVADMRREGPPAPDGISLRRGAAVGGVVGRGRVEGVRLGSETVEADALLVSGGLTPSVHLFCQGGGKLRWDETLLAFLPREPVAGMAVAGAANGRFSLSEALAEGHRAGGGEDGASPRAAGDDDSYGVRPAWPAAGGEGRQWIDHQNDVTLKDVELAARENFRSVEHLKRYTTLGMATDQGKTSNMVGLAAMAAITGQSIEATGTTTYRPPFVPVPFTAVAGRRRGELMNPVRRLVLEREHRAAGARFREYGGWLRPAWYGSDDGAREVEREARVARDGVAIFDGSPLGKISVIGPDAGALLDFNSYNTISTLKPGRVRYGFMLTESGVVYDDGVTVKWADDHYVVSCSSGHVAGVAARLEEWRQDRFDPARVAVHNMTAQWATLTATGPRAKALAGRLGLDIDLGDEALPHMAAARGRWRGGPVRVARVSFTGDRSYELSVPGARAAELLAAMRDAGRELGAALMGSEALLLLRAEKGYLIAGKDTDGTTMPHDLGVSGPRDRRRDEFVGRRSLFTEEARRASRRQFVGLAAVEGDAPLPVGAHAVERRGKERRSAGFVTSSYQSPTLGRPIALGLVERGAARMGEEVELVHLGRTLTARIVAPCALDPEGKRLDA